MGRQALRHGLIGAAAGATLSYLFEPQLGRRRRRLLRDRARSLTRRGLRSGLRLERRAQSNLYARLMAASHRHERPKTYDDITLVHKVESLLYRDPLVPKGRLNIDACEAVVTLRGMIDDPQTIERIVDRVRQIQGVRGVESLLHPPGTPPPHRDGRPRESTTTEQPR